MKNKILPVLTLAALSVLTPAVLADDGTNTVNSNTNSVPLAPNMLGEHLGRTTKATDLISQNIKNYQEVSLGKVKDLAVDVEAGRIVYVIASAGGVLGVGGTVCAVPPGALHQEATNNDALYLDANQDQLEASKFDADNWAENCGTNQVAEVYARFGQEPFFLLDQAADTNLLAPRQLEEWITDHRLMSSPHLGYVERASKVIGLSVSNYQDEAVGRVADLILDLPAGRVVALVISSGDYMGKSGELSAIPATSFRYNAQTNGLRLDVTKQTLGEAPHFPQSQWPDLDATYAATVYRAYAVSPYFDTNSMPEADNTAWNVRDRNGGTLTPLDQGNDQSDLNITAHIRREIVASDSLSFTAKNIKIITEGGKVTLRGPVNNAEEKRQINWIAANVAGTNNVDDQIDVKSSASNP